jgi:hypothetical protein
MNFSASTSSEFSFVYLSQRQGAPIFWFCSEQRREEAILPLGGGWKNEQRRRDKGMERRRNEGTERRRNEGTENKIRATRKQWDGKHADGGGLPTEFKILDLFLQGARSTLHSDILNYWNNGMLPVHVLMCRAANESSSSEPGLAQARLMKIKVESSWDCETLRAKKCSSSSARYYLSWLMS